MDKPVKNESADKLKEIREKSQDPKIKQEIDKKLANIDKPFTK